jgi:hypothetical protein
VGVPPAIIAEVMMDCIAGYNRMKNEEIGDALHKKCPLAVVAMDMLRRLLERSYFVLIRQSRRTV